MAYVQTGKQISLTFTLTKLINGTVVNTITYDGLLAFDSYPQITTQELKRLPFEDYITRLTAFKAYVENIESGLVFDECIVAGFEPYRDNTDACPIGVIPNE